MAARGEHPGLVDVIAAMEACESYRRWHDKPRGMYLRPDSGKCLHYYYYFYFIDEARGLCYLRVPTWCPFRLQFSIGMATAGWRALTRLRGRDNGSSR